jgi:DNA helicase-2/ATP-dependent DNA helicase PcrA
MSKNILSGLNPQQKEAVLHPEGPILVLAGAGSGKTRLIAHKFAYLTKKVPPSSILALTFTNRAAEEMKDRISDLAGKDLKQCWIGTFHSQCLRILRREIGALGYSADFSIYDDDEQLSLIRHILKELNLYEALYKGVLSKISYLKSNMMGPKEFLSKSDGFGFEERLAKVYIRYQDELKKSNALDFDDLIVLAIRLFEENPKTLSKYNQSFEYTLVDEFQDTNPCQYRLLKLLAGRNKNICAVGDDDQSIYRFRGADLSNILEFEKDFPGTKIVKLEQSYRCTQNILDASNGVISKNSKRRPKKLWTGKGDGETVCYFWLNSEEEEARHIAKTIREFYLKNNFGYGDFAVLYRVNTQSRVIEDVLQSEGVPYKVMGGMSFYQRKEIKDITAYLKLVLNGDDNVALRRIINCPPRGIGASTISKVEQHAKKKAISLFAAAKALLRANGIVSSMKERLEAFVGLIETIAAKNCKDAAQLTTEVLEATSYMEELSEDRAENVREFLSSASGREIKEFIDKLSLSSATDDGCASGAVSLMTIHSAKGLEFPVVFIAGLEEGLLPYFKAKLPEEVAEERRLLYVGMTRAKKILCLTGAKRRRVFAKIKEQRPSRFMQDVPSNCCMVVEKIPQGAAAREEPAKALPARFPYVAGARVRHQKWGVGIVRDCYGEGDEAKVTVNFPSIGIKKLAIKFANLEKIQG